MAFRFAELLPWREFVINTRFTPDEAASVLTRNIGEARFLSAGDHVFTGERREPFRFKLTRSIAYRNSFLPIVDVEIKPRDAAGARVHVAMRLHGVVAVFMTIWTSGALLGGLVGVVLCGGGFAYEARQATELLQQIFPPAMGEPPYR